ncbi:MAG: diphthamide synthesis protein [Candidatus Woesearchaeota archaeon]|nr:MAG: diphthamide synthesis protein [Candidatus Woesearchaeota archaeon]
MKILHVHAKANITITLPTDLLRLLPKRVLLFTTIQCYHQFETIKEQLVAAGITPIVAKTIHTRHPGQILGCNTQNFSEYIADSFDAILYVGDGLFHPTALQMKNEVDVHAYDPFTNTISLVKSEDVAVIRKQEQAAKSAFYLAENVGVLVSTKPGQQFLRHAKKLETLYPQKKFYYLLDNTLDIGGLEDFPFIEVFVNTACPRIALDEKEKFRKPIVNLEDVSNEFLEHQLSSAKNN